MNVEVAFFADDSVAIVAAVLVVFVVDVTCVVVLLFT